MIRSWAESQGIADRIIIRPISDYIYDEDDVLWLRSVQETVDAVVGDDDAKIGLIGHAKDNTSYYLKKFPQWGNEDVPAFTDRALFNATDVRNIYFGKQKTDYIDWASILKGIPPTTMSFLEEFHTTQEFQDRYDDHQYALTYREDHSYRNTKIRYAPAFTTVDAVVLQAGHILVVTRGAHPGKGQIALPGGFLDAGERLKQAVLRELYQETKLRVPKDVLAGSITSSDIFDEEFRSSRGRVISYTTRFDLKPRVENNYKLPRVRGGDDARKAYWMPLSKLREQDMFEDHFHIIRAMTGAI
jgi:bifunctional NMN adenylyltransferase/nudix hydrolase